MGWEWRHDCGMIRQKLVSKHIYILRNIERTWQETQQWTRHSQHYAPHWKLQVQPFCITSSSDSAPSPVNKCQSWIWTWPQSQWFPPAPWRRSTVLCWGFNQRLKIKAAKQQASEFKVEERETAWLRAPASEFRKTSEVCLKSTIFWLLLPLTDGGRVK